MDEVSREGRQLIDSVRRHDGLDASRREQLKRGVMLGVGGAVGVGALGAASHAAAATIPAASAAQLTSSASAVGVQLTFGKLLLIAATGGAVGTGLVVATLPPEAKPQPSAQVQVQGTPRTSSSTRSRLAGEPSLAAYGSSDSTPPTAQFAPVPVSPSIGTARVSAVQAPKASLGNVALTRSEAAPPTAQDSARPTAPLPSVGSFSTPALDQELQTIRSAQRALRAGKGQEVLNSLDQSKPPQVLTEEYAATRVFALCSAGHIAEGQSAARTFLNTYPRSPLRPKVASACNGK
ncbi:MAG: hypothetical protein SFV15_09720 [Polyangiaceae bacterium]|nr:hypothetical protein [Polyangiaceae bacterium]